MQLNAGIINAATINGVSGAEIPVPVNPNELPFAEGYGVVSSVDMQRSIVYSEAFNVSDSLSSTGDFIFDVYARHSYKNRIKIGWIADFAESLQITGNTTLDKYLIIEIIEAVMLADESITQLNAVLNLAEIITFETNLSSGNPFDFTESMGIVGDSEVTVSFVTEYLESLNIIDSLSNTARLFFSPVESIDIDASVSSQASLVANFSESMLIGGFIDLPEGLFEAWVVNAETRSPYQYTNFPFNSFAMIGGNYYGADESGLFSLDGDTDDGTAIDASIKSGLINLGTTLFKNIPRAYFGYTSSGQLLFNTITTESGQKIERWYELKEKTAEDTTNARVKMARGVKSVYWQFEIINVDGADFDFDEIKLMPAILKRRR